MFVLPSHWKRENFSKTLKAKFLKPKQSKGDIVHQLQQLLRQEQMRGKQIICA